MVRLLFLALFSFVFAPRAMAGYLGVEGSILQDSNDLNTSASTSRNIYEGYLNVPLSEKTILFLGVGYMVVSASDPATNTATKTLDASMFEINFGLYLNKSRTLKANVIYVPSVNASYSRTDTSGTESWSGTAVGGKISFAPDLWKRFSPILAFTYLTMDFDTKSKTSASVTTKNSFSRTIMYPSIGLQFSF